MGTDEESVDTQVPGDPLVKTQRTVFSSHSPSGDEATSPPFTRRYSYEELDSEPRRTYSPSSHGFKYEDGQNQTGENDDSQKGSESVEVRRAHAQAFNYAPGEEETVHNVHKKKSTAASPPSSPSSPDTTLPETSVDDSRLNTSADSTGIAAGFGLLRKGKKDKKDKDGDKDKKSKKKKKSSGDDSASSPEKGDKGKKSADGKAKKKGRFQLFSGGKKQKKRHDSTSSSSSSDSSSSDSDSDDSVVKEGRHTAQPKDVDHLLQASDASFMADRSDASTLVHPAETTAELSSLATENTPAETTAEESSYVADRSNSDVTVNAALDGTSDAPKIVKTTTKKTFVQDDEGVSQDLVQKIEDVSSGTLQVEEESLKVGIFNIVSDQ